jgi:hypothetical protein
VTSSAAWASYFDLPGHQPDEETLAECRGGRTHAGVIVRVLQRILALTTAIWLNDKTAAHTHRSLTAYDH